MRDVDLGAIDADLRACLEAELSLPGVRLVKRKGRLFLKGRKFEILAERLCALKPRWVELVERADLPDEDKWKIFCLLVGGDGRLEEVAGVGLKVTLPPRRRH